MAFDLETFNASDYLWMVIVGGIAMFSMGFGIGANDVANNIGSAIGAGTLTFRKAVVLAAVFELFGAVALGASVTDSVKGGIIKAEFAEQRPDLLMWANLAALLTGTVWLVGCSLVGLPVSTTHTTIGCLFGTGIACPNGVNIINWQYLGTIVASWFISPILCWILVLAVFSGYRKFIFRCDAEKGLKRAKNSLWFTMFATMSVFGIFFMVKTPITKDWAKHNIGAAVGVGFAIGLVAALIVTPLCFWLSKRGMAKTVHPEVQATHLASVLSSLESGHRSLSHGSLSHSLYDGKSLSRSHSKSSSKSSCHGALEAKCAHCGENPAEMIEPELLSMSSEEEVGCNDKIRRKWYALPWFMDIQAAALGGDPHAQAAADNLEKFPPTTEKFFQYLQIITATLACVVHGANDVANATAPFSGIYGIYQNNGFSEDVSTDYWILALGGGSIGIGVFFLGHKVIMSMGFKLAAITPGRGFCMELGSTLVMVLGSFLGIPLSTTHCKVGGTMAIAMLEPGPDNKKINFKAMNGKLLLKILASWVGTLVVAGAMSAVVFALGVYSPSI